MEKEIILKLHKNFEDYVHEEDGIEFWYARDLQHLLGYNRWENFENAVLKAKIACETSKQAISDHFRDVTKTIPMPKGATKEISDIMLTRYACYLIAQNGDPRKDEIAFAMTYFAIQTRKQELVEQRLGEWERLQAREKLTLSEKELSGVIFQRGVDSQGFARIRSQGDAALFGGHTTQDMKYKLKVPAKRPLADFLPTVTIKAKDLASEITNHNLKKDQALRGETLITHEHVKNNKNMREMLGKSGIYPEALPAEEDLKKLDRRLRSESKKISKTVRKLRK
ncbi:MAG: DNA damage-inducible protein D [Candidatus Moranbacteria bacterium RIFOXYA12_FULL_35_19]|nr:MAG: DNA-damage-inducible protein D [Candidatus Moranbacteria bacterium GW2011_GWF2_35_39]OGI31940.1 MAG: DNA damage-inducible protein D [Candidatus Moranbacteria bacterium RIFOXYB12_FULL_35_8]OGI33186.1 MAG: DNA damage-inducible protein D [Candidatus Moranbacteria bacterium RIFOXYC12_FULL_36_13]OGI36652.1 MAG: DNA damage-inducible protein D [Candidatus Moranbacteria bacterium RIFOXYA12_FULL_35_19]